MTLYIPIITLDFDEYSAYSLAPQPTRQEAVSSAWEHLVEVSAKRRDECPDLNVVIQKVGPENDPSRLVIDYGDGTYAGASFDCHDVGGNSATIQTPPSFFIPTYGAPTPVPTPVYA